MDGVFCANYHATYLLPTSLMSCVFNFFPVRTERVPVNTPKVDMIVAGFNKLSARPQKTTTGYGSLYMYMAVVQNS